MSLQVSRYLAVIFAVGLGIGETAINWGHWQYAPLWIIDYVIVIWLLWAFWLSRIGQNLHCLMNAWAFTMGIFYMALFISMDPENQGISAKPDIVMLILIGLMFAISVIGFVSAFMANQSKESG